MQFQKRHYNNDTSYRQSKQANRMLTVAYAEKFKDLKILVNSCHPGDVNSKLSNDLGFGGSMSADAGAKTPVFLATAPLQTTGKYFSQSREVPCEFSKDTQSIQDLYKICLGFC